MQHSDIFTKSSDMLNKNTLGVKKCEANKKHVQPKSLISAEAKKSPNIDVLNYVLE